MLAADQDEGKALTAEEDRKLSQSDTWQKEVAELEARLPSL